ncbi:hypothetical protein INT47_009609 [Mucor saturninus]|uniref:RRM domain-containing protein n=1 Tax=Mucor saturninus TaxID=64648 RepID=A0A8H7QQL1_9FUNG|nr:hypothetical protein INT47_009609 [Mucor saturninus]
MKTTLFVAGFNSRTRARNLAYEFERYGRLVRCDIPAPKSYSSKPYAFVEFENTRDAEDAFNEMHGRTIEGYTLSVQWARGSNSSFDPNRRTHHHHHNSNMNNAPPLNPNNTSRSRSPYRRERSSSPPRGRSPPRYNNSSPTRNRLRSRSRSPLGSNSFQRRRSFSRSPIDN